MKRRATTKKLELEFELERANHRDRAREGLLNFTVYTFSDYMINWHHRVVCQYLNRFAAGEIKRLMIFTPPRVGKSELVSRRLPAFILGKEPDAQIIATSYSADLAARMNRDVQRIIDSDEYRELFPETFLYGKNIRTLAGAWQRNSDIFEIVGRRGVYRSSGVGGGITGMGANYCIIDDPIKNQEEADSAVYRERVWQWYTSTLYTRLERAGGLCLTMTRWHEDDLAGRLLDRAKSDPAADQWTVVNLPALCEEKSGYDPRELGDALWPWKYPKTTMQAIKASVGTKVWNALYMQRPAPDSGLLVNRAWWKFYDKLPEKFDQIIQAWDLTFKDAKNSDYVVGVVVGKIDRRIFLLDMVRDRLSFTATLAVIRNMVIKWPTATVKLVEEAANGAAVIDTLKKEIGGIIPVRAQGSKVARVNAISPRIEAGDVFLPSTRLAPWVSDVLEEWAAFPSGKNDDIVDAMTYAITRLSSAKPIDWVPISMTGVNPYK